MDEPRIAPLGDRAGLALVDPKEGVRYELRTPDREPQVDVGQPTVAAEDLPVPVDDAVGVVTRRLVVPNDLRVNVRTLEFDDRGTLRDHPPLDPETRYLLEPASTPCKVYVTAPAGWQVTRGDGEVALSWPRPVPVDVAIRSLSSGPDATVTVPERVTDEARALSLLGAGLDTVTPERSWPTLRGHPPLFERGEAFEAPGSLSPPAPGITLRVPPERAALYPLAPLAYYLGAAVETEPGADPALEAAGERWPLGAEDPCPTANRFLRRVVFLDCLCRTAGLYEDRLAEHDDLAAALDAPVDWWQLYELPADERVAAYLDARFDVVDEEDLVPRWPTTVDLSAAPSSFELLPYVAGELAMVRLLDGAETAGEVATDGARRAGGRRAQPDVSATTVRPPAVETPEHVWLRGGRPLEAAQPDPPAVRRWSAQTPSDAALSVDLVCNDPEMTDEVIEDIYDVRDVLELDLTLQVGLSRAALRETFESQSDLVHYVGHVDRDGMQCTDGSLDASAVTDAPQAVLLNACRTYEQGRKLLEAGAIASVVTLTEVSNLSATRGGQEFARLLSAGFRVRAAVTLLQEYLTFGHRYQALGAGDLQLVQAPSGTPQLLEVLPGPSDDQYSVRLQYYPTRAYHLGTRTQPELDAVEQPNLAFGRSRRWTVDAETLAAFVSREHCPVDVGGQLVWSDELAVALRETDAGHTEVIDRLLRGIWGEELEGLDQLRSPG